MSPRKLSRPRHTEFAGTMEMDGCAGPSAQFWAFFSSFAFSFFLTVFGGKDILTRNKPTLRVKRTACRLISPHLLGSLSSTTSLRWGCGTDYKAVWGTCHLQLQRWCWPWADGWLRRGSRGVYCIVTKGKQFGEFKFHLQGRGGGVLEQ